MSDSGHVTHWLGLASFSALLLGSGLGVSDVGSSLGRSPASMLCPMLARGESQSFSASLFLQKVEKYRQTPPSQDEVERALGRPEDLLAVVECLAQQEYQSALDWSRLIQDLKPSELKRLSKVLGSLPEKRSTGLFDDVDFEKFSVELYRVMHRPRGFWRHLWSEKSLARAFDQINNEKISERIFQESLRSGLIPMLEQVIPFKEKALWSTLNLPNVRKGMGYTLGFGLWMVSVSMSVVDVQDIGFTWSNVVSFIPAAMPFAFHRFLFKARGEDKWDLLLRKKVADAAEIQDVRKVLLEKMRSRRGTEIMKKTVFFLTAIAISSIWANAFADVSSRQALSMAAPELARVTELSKLATLSPSDQVEFEIREIENRMVKDGKGPMDPRDKGTLRQILLDAKLKVKERAANEAKQ